MSNTNPITQIVCAECEQEQAECECFLPMFEERQVTETPEEPRRIVITNTEAPDDTWHDLLTEYQGDVELVEYHLQLARENPDRLVTGVWRESDGSLSGETLG